MSIEGQRIGEYLVRRRLGVGGMAEVYAAERRGPGGFRREVALKVLRAHLAALPSVVERFTREARLAATLRHPNLVPVIDFGVDRDVAYLVMELVDGPDLRRAVLAGTRASRPLPPVLAVHVALQVCRGLGHAHRQVGSGGRPLGLVHRDISPQNILLSRSGEVRLTDFGIASVARAAEESASGTLRGKFAYLAPEQVEGGGGDRRADLFALGVVLWELLAGRRLFHAPTDAETLARVRRCEVPLPPVPTPPEVPQPLWSALAPALAREPGARYADADAMAAALAAACPEADRGEAAARLAEWLAAVEPVTPMSPVALPTGVDPRLPGVPAPAGSAHRGAWPHDRTAEPTAGPGRGLSADTSATDWPGRPAPAGPAGPVDPTPTLLTLPSSRRPARQAFRRAGLEIERGPRPRGSGSPGSRAPRWRRTASAAAITVAVLAAAAMLGLTLGRQGSAPTSSGRDASGARAQPGTSPSPLPVAAAGVPAAPGPAGAQGLEAAPGTPARPVAAVPPAAEPQPARGGEPDPAAVASGTTPHGASGRPVPRPSASLATQPSAALIVASRPAGALIELNGRPHGRTPRRLQGLRPDEPVVVRLRLDGYRSAEQTVTPSTREVRAVEIVLEPAFGTLSVDAVPWAEVWIGGRHIGSTPMFGRRIQAGRHTVRLVHPPSGRAVELEVHVEPDGEVRRRVVLAPPAASSGLRTPESEAGASASRDPVGR